MKKLLTVLAFASALSLSACKSTGGTESNEMMMNTSCPISSKPVDANVSVDYMGKKVGLCCKGCVGKWEALSADEKAAKVK